MTNDTKPNKPEPAEYINHWAQWWGITLERLLDAPSGTNERRKAYELHQEAKGNLSHSLGIADRRIDHG